MATDPGARASAALERLAGRGGTLGVAVSGGGDSVALLHLAAQWGGARLMAASVDHGLRPEAGAEIALAARHAASLHLPHEVLRWDGAARPGNLMANARAGRHELLARWATGNRLDAVLLGHTRDDVAETLLMRLARGAGIDGLSAMADSRRVAGATFLRPLLGIGRDELRDWLRQRGLDWRDDPSNDDPRFDRARLRQAMRTLGLRPEALALSAGHLAEARDALAAGAAALVAEADADAGVLTLPAAPLLAAAPELRRRIVVAALRWITAADYPPRRAALDHALALLVQGRQASVGGALLRPGPGIAVLREPAACRREACVVDGVWDRRWRLGDPAAEPRPMAEVAPRGVRLDDEIASRPAVRVGGEWRDATLGDPPLARPVRDVACFRQILIGH